MIGSQSGSVMSATSTSPAWNSRICADRLQDAHRPGADLLADGTALDHERAPLVHPVARARTVAAWRDFTVSGRACRT